MPSRASGILLHVTSLPSRFGIGDLGPEAYRFVDFLAEAKQRWWQVLPVGPCAGAECSPYRAASAFAGNPLLLSPELLRDDGLLDDSDLAAVSGTLPDDRVDFGAVERAKEALLERACRRFLERGERGAFDAFCERQAGWLEPFAHFRAAGRSGDARDFERREMCIQFLFEDQWSRLREYAYRRGVRIFGDVPFYVDLASADVQNHPHLFKLDRDGRPRVVSGVPPDAFSATGQLWGNPVYEWTEHSRDDFAWWVARISRNFEWFDLVRLDHFRGFSAHWEVPAGSTTAIDGRWVEGPGHAFFEALEGVRPTSGLVAEDLGTITDDVRELMDVYELPGMRVLLFAFDGDTGSNHHSLHHHRPCDVVYTGTHDNNTARGWLEEDTTAEARARLARYVGRERSPEDVGDALVRMAMLSVCQLAIIPAQDLLGLGSSARMNHPARSHGNWTWRILPGSLGPQLAQHLGDMTEAYGRT